MANTTRSTRPARATRIPSPGLSRAVAEREVERLELAELVRRGADGDLLAYERLFGWLTPQLVRYAKVQGRRLYLEARLVDEVIDESLSRVHLTLHTLRDPRKIVSWLHRIVWNELLRARDDQRRLAVIADPAEMMRQTERGEPQARGGDVESLLEFRDLLDEIARLPGGQRSVIVLRDLFDIDVAETSRLLGVSPGTVKSQRHDGIRNLRAGLAARGHWTTVDDGSA
jgi:RNA polymerase sigma-70 factor (ECF subfamily)